MPNALVVADDLTGAMDTGHGFAARGFETRVRMRAHAAPARTTATVLSVDTDSRYEAAETAAERVRAAIDAHPAPLAYKKVDSTLRGNVVAEVDAALGATGARAAIVAPAYPASGRTTHEGVHLVGGGPLAETEHAADEKGPTASRLAELFAPSEHQFVHVGVESIDPGPDATLAAIEDAMAAHTEAVLVGCDATEDRHLASIAGAAERLETRPLLVGSGGLAAHVAVPDASGAGGRVHSSDAGVDTDGRGALGIVGSVNERTLEQLSAVDSGSVVEVDPRAAVSDPDAAGREAADRAVARLTAGERAVVTAARTRDAVDRALSAGREAGYETGEVRDRVAGALSAAARNVFERRCPAGLFVTGGDVAVEVFTALDARTIALSGEAVGEGIPIGRLEDGSAAGTTVVTKAGGFGDRGAVVNCLRFLTGDR